MVPAVTIRTVYLDIPGTVIDPPDHEPVHSSFTEWELACTLNNPYRSNGGDRSDHALKRGAQMADDQTIDGRVTALEQTAERHETRITTHGKEIDKLNEAMIEKRVNDSHRDETMRRIESKQDTLSGKIDSLLLKPASKWEDAKWIVISVVITAVATWLLSNVGL